MEGEITEERYKRGVEDGKNIMRGEYLNQISENIKEKKFSFTSEKLIEICKEDKPSEYPEDLKDKLKGEIEYFDRILGLWGHFDVGEEFWKNENLSKLYGTNKCNKKTEEYSKLLKICENPQMMDEILGDKPLHSMNIIYKLYYKEDDLKKTLHEEFDELKNEGVFRNHIEFYETFFATLEDIWRESEKYEILLEDYFEKRLCSKGFGRPLTKFISPPFFKGYGGLVLNKKEAKKRQSLFKKFVSKVESKFWKKKTSKKKK